MKKQRLTEGNVFFTLLKFSMPFLLANLLQAAYGAADLLIVGQCSDAANLSAVATGSQVMQTVTGLCVGLSTGGTVVIGQQFGSRNHRGMLSAMTANFALFGLVSILLTSAILLALDPICALMQTPAEALAATRSYLLICSGGIFFIIGYNAVSAVLRGLGDSRTPLLFVAAACVLNILGDLLLVGKFKLGAAGAAFATVGSQAFSLLLAGLYLCAQGLISRFWRRRVRIEVCSVRRILAVGAPIGLQDGLINVSFLIITAIVNTMGVTASAAVGVVEKLIVFSMLPTTAFAASVSAMTAQHQGAGLYRRGRLCLLLGILLSTALGGAFCLCAQWNGEALLRLFTPDQAILKAGADYLRSYSWDCILVCLVFCLNAYFSGCGLSLFPLAHSVLATFAVRVPFSYLMSRRSNPSMLAIGCAAPLATLLSCVLCLFYLFRLVRRQNARLAR